MGVFLNSLKLAQDGAEAHGVSNAALTPLAVMRCALDDLRLRLGLQEDDLGAVDRVRLDVGQVYIFLDVGHAHHVAVGSAPHLDGSVTAVGVGELLRTQGAGLRAVEAELVALVLPRRVILTMREEKLAFHQLRQPRRPLTIRKLPTHHHYSLPVSFPCSSLSNAIHSQLSLNSHSIPYNPSSIPQCHPQNTLQNSQPLSNFLKLLNPQRPPPIGTNASQNQTPNPTPRPKNANLVCTPPHSAPCVPKCQRPCTQRPTM